MSKWNREERTKPRTITGLAEFFRVCGVAISARYIHAAIKSGGYVLEFGNLTTADHFLRWKGKSGFKCHFPKREKKARPSPRPAQTAAHAGTLGG